MDCIGDGWSLLIVRDAFDGVRRFSEFEKSLGAAKNILAARLHHLVEHGIMEVVPASDGSRYQEYVLSEKGRALFPVIVAIRQWGERYFFQPGEPYTQLVDRKRAKPLRQLKIQSADGRIVGPDDTFVQKPNTQENLTQSRKGAKKKELPEPRSAGKKDSLVRRLPSGSARRL
jgi:DNA-binding HxlR family transcriptional regulator